MFDQRLGDDLNADAGSLSLASGDAFDKCSANQNIRTINNAEVVQSGVHKGGNLLFGGR